MTRPPTETFMRTATVPPLPRRPVVTLLVLLAAAGPASAADLPVRIAAARVGFPPAGATAGPVAKFGAWAPVEVDVELTADLREPFDLVVEAPDADGVTTVLKVPAKLRNAGSGRERGYVRPTGGEVVLTFRKADGSPLSEPYRIRSVPVRPSSTYVVLGLGSTLPGFELPGPTDAPAGSPLRNGRVELAAITDPEGMSSQWFGYDAADLIVISKHSADQARIFSHGFGPLDSETRRRFDALIEWVRRGGRLVLAGHDLPGLLFNETELFDKRPDGPRTRTVDRLPLYWSARETSQSTVLGGVLAGSGPLTVANLPGQPVRGRVVIPPASRQGAGTEPVAVQAAYGLGKVTFIGFDLDRPPFTDAFPQRAEFWDWVLREGGAARASVGTEGRPPGGLDDEDDVAAAVRNHLDTFEGVPVVSFGLVGTLIALYALLIAPVEFFLVRRVLRRPVLSWVTLPLMAAAVSGLAYWSASASKGHELRVNKIDIVDVMAAATGAKPGSAGWQPRVHGTTLFTLFGPKTAAYSVGVSPADGWAARRDAGGPLVGWAGGPRGVRPGLLRRKYDYHSSAETAADGLEGVPVQVWSTKGFTADWMAEGDRAAPLAESRLEHPPGDPTKAIGTFVNRVPAAELLDCVALYAGAAYPLGTILSGQEVRLVLDRGTPAGRYFQENARLADLRARAAGPSAEPGRGVPLGGLLFHEAALRNEAGVFPGNASLRRLDQSWRLAADHRDEVIVVGRVAPTAEPAGPLFDGPTSPTRLWLNGLPGSGTARAPVPGVGRQETYVRLYLPVKSNTP